MGTCARVFGRAGALEWGTDMNFIKRLTYKSRKFYDDDFDWENYTDDSRHRRLKNDVESSFLTIAKEGDLSFDEKTGVLGATGQVLHPNAAAILEVIGQLQPEVVHEIGCGGGDHVANANTVFSTIRTTGSDRGASQIALARQRHPDLASCFNVQDVTMPFSRYWQRAELVYSQAVIMHIHTAVSHFVALSNMVAMADKYVFLMENLQCHNFVADISNLFKRGHLAWDSLHIYRFDGSAGARGLLLSKEELDYPVASSDAFLREGQKYSSRRVTRANQDSERGNFSTAPD